MYKPANCYGEKHGCAFNNMDSPSRFEPAKAEGTAETELSEVKVIMPRSSVATSTPAQPGSMPCRNGGLNYQFSGGFFRREGTSKDHTAKGVSQHLDPIATSTITQDKAVQMWKNPSAERLRNDNDADDDSSVAEDFQRRSRYILVGWDSFRSKTMLLLLVLLLLWASIYFPLIES
ncbi:hypothetical protein KM043_018176 [Ampulex compressa]|nr:hypothetical protein KM043_018176 [Ampulex compressa]